MCRGWVANASEPARTRDLCGMVLRKRAFGKPIDVFQLLKCAKPAPHVGLKNRSFHFLDTVARDS